MNRLKIKLQCVYRLVFESRWRFELSILVVEPHGVGERGVPESRVVKTALRLRISVAQCRYL
jgi:hypothetical protein